MRHRRRRDEPAAATRRASTFTLWPASVSILAAGPMGRTLHRYVFLQVLAPFAAGLALFTFILLIARIMKLVEMVVNRGVPVLEILRVFSYILPAFLEVTVPMALLLACLLACGRLSADSEITALKAAGPQPLPDRAPDRGLRRAGLRRCRSFLSLYARPWGNAALKTGDLRPRAHAARRVGLKEHVFNDEFKGLVIYVEQIEPPGTTLLRILISDRRQPSEENTVVAQARHAGRERGHPLGESASLRRRHLHQPARRAGLPQDRFQRVRRQPEPERGPRSDGDARARSERDAARRAARAHRGAREPTASRRAGAGRARAPSLDSLRRRSSSP